MNEQQLESLEKLFPKGYCILFKEPNSRITIQSSQGENGLYRCSAAILGMVLKRLNSGEDLDQIAKDIIK